MSSEEAYLLQNKGEAIFRDRGSRFLAFAYPIENEKQAMETIRMLKEEHPQAVHVCFAWVLDRPEMRYRYSDDGEPSGSAGLPIYHQLLSHQVLYSALAVVRYYGGKKLGIPGLIHAYGTAADEALTEAGKTPYVPRHSYRILYDPNMNYRFFEFTSAYHADILENDLLKGLAVISFQGQLLPKFEEIPSHYTIFDFVHLSTL